MNPSGYYQQQQHGYAAYPQQAYSPQMTAAAFAMLQQQQQQQYAVALQQQQQQQHALQPAQYAAALQQQQQQQAMKPAQQQSHSYGKTAGSATALKPRQQPQLAMAPLTKQPAVAAAHVGGIQDLLDDGSVAIKPFSPDKLDNYHNVYLLTLGGTYYRCSPKVQYVNPYDIEGANNGLIDKPLASREWAKMRDTITKDLEKRLNGNGDAESVISAAFTSDSIADDEHTILLNPMETIIAHAKETVALPHGIVPVVEAIPDIGRCMIDVRLTRNLGWGGEVFRPSLVITNRSSHAKAILVVGRPIAVIGLTTTPYYDAQQAGPGPAHTEARIKAYNARWTSSLLINEAAAPEVAAPQQPTFFNPAAFRFQQQ